MARNPYVPYDKVLAAIFSAMNISIDVVEYNGKRGWDEDDFEDAMTAAYAYLFSHPTFNYDDDPEDDRDEVYDLLDNYEYELVYWSSDSGHMPE